MKVIITKVLSPFGLDTNQVYGFCDFILGFLLITMPWFNYHDSNLLTLTLTITSGAALILYSIFTDYNKGILKFIAQKIHQALDITLGVTFMALIPAQSVFTSFAISCLGAAILFGAYLL